MSDHSDAGVNEHYLDRVVEAAGSTSIEATEDILTGAGVKLLAKGAQIDTRTRDRLLQHKLRKPLEWSIRVVDGAAGRPLNRLADELLCRHALLAGVCREQARHVVLAMRDLRLATPIESLLSLYAAQGAKKLEHAVGVSLLATAMILELPTGGEHELHTMLLAGLLHDVGELYIDPTILRSKTRLMPDQWKHIAAHPIIAARVLREMPNGVAPVAEAVLHHHERLDGFGYPQGLAGSRLPLAGQTLGMAEMLMGLIESGFSPGERASVAVKLVPGEFDRRLLDRVATGANVSSGRSEASQTWLAQQGADLARRSCLLAETLRGLSYSNEAVALWLRGGSAPFRGLIAHVIERLERIRLAFSSTGLDSHGSDDLATRLDAMSPGVHFEVSNVLQEVEWRLREVRREACLRAERLSPQEAALVHDFFARMFKAMME